MGRAALFLLSCLGLACTSAGGSTPAPADLVNSYRAGHGLSALQPAADLTVAAQRWVDHLADTGTLRHDVLTLTPAWAALGENVGRGASIEDIQRALEASPAHERNLVGSYTHLGAAIATRGATVWVVQRFGTLGATTTTTQPLTTTATRAATTTRCM